MYPGTPTSTVAKKALTATVPDLNRILYSTCIYYCIHARTMQYCTVRVLYRAHTMYPALPFHHTMYRTRVDVKGRRTLLHLMYPGTPTFALECGTCTPLDVPRYTYFGIQISEERPSVDPIGRSDTPIGVSRCRFKIHILFLRAYA